MRPFFRLQNVSAYIGIPSARPDRICGTIRLVPNRTPGTVRSYEAAAGPDLRYTPKAAAARYEKLFLKISCKMLDNTVEICYNIIVKRK